MLCIAGVKTTANVTTGMMPSRIACGPAELGYAMQLGLTHVSDDPRPRDVAVTHGVKYRRLPIRVHVVHGTTVLKEELAPQHEPTERDDMVSLIQQGKIVGGKFQL